ncbi:hypothetical protein, variant [Aphanomyces astaci]|uniref:Uncharacterized protein n=1 Tax=Aphanomyces astaci TaxID=112090 RepID=W4FMR5_APHAT|nr:hypothetical protein, variant [Aphanomyces astaci]ETV68099.1 hypothetical protein, variant [Aphanomyces astaci]|eukprot:XP_009842398.1 hypothetical protein, variant [Aphanomyces astaci]
MTKKILFDRIRHILDELFVDVSDDKFEFSALGDLFQDSHFRLQDSFVKSDVFNALPLPFTLKVAYIGHIRIEGFWGVMTSGSALRCTISDSLFVFGANQHIDWTDELQLRYAHELAVALLHRLWNRYHIEGKGPQKNESTKTWIKKRVTAALHNMTIQVENTQCRVEIDADGSGGSDAATTDVVGFIMPKLSVFSTDVASAILCRRALPPQVPVLTEGMSKVVAIDGLQVYTSRIPTTQRSPDQWKALFHRQWPAEVHVAVLVPTDIKVKVDLEECHVTRKLKTRAVDLHVNQLNVGLDPQQIDVLGRLLQHLDTHERYTRYRKLRPTQVVRADVDPAPLVIVSFNVLPHIQPVEPTSASTSPIRAPFPARAMWKYAVRCVLQDVFPKRRDGQDNVLWLSKLILKYTDLYKRKMGSTYVEYVVRDLLVQHKQGNPSLPPVLPTYEPLSRAELWHLSDLMYQLTPDRQLYCRALVDRIIRQEFVKRNAKQALSDLSRGSSSSVVRRGSLERLGRVHSFLKDESAWNLVDVEAVLFDKSTKHLMPLAPSAAAVAASAQSSHKTDVMTDVVQKYQSKPMVHVDIGHIRFAFRHVDAAHAPRKKEWEFNCEFLRGCAAVAASPLLFVLLEVRLGSVTASIVGAPDSHDCLVVVDCISDPNDGCLYAGLRYDPSNIASEYAWKGKLMTGAIKASLSPCAVIKFQRTLSSKLHDSSLSLEEIATGRHKTFFCKPLHSVVKPPTTKKDRAKAFLEHALQLPTMLEVQTQAVAVEVRAPTHHVVANVLATPAWIPLVRDIALDAVEIADLHVPANRWAIAHDVAANTLQVDGLQHQVKFRNTRAGHAAAIQRLLHQLFPDLV